ncbi:hypothetical protein [Aestuariivirga sp.]|uniref:hypothetical protein n=1 Tax=Aestuariivirga sp. TaxID=2650926 RepID=UPI00391A450D
MEMRRAKAAPAQIPGNTALGTVGSTEVPRKRETAEYLADMILELRNLARSNQLFTVMVPLEYAYYEAFGVANRVEVPQSEIDRIRTLSKASEEFEPVPPTSA